MFIIISYFVGRPRGFVILEKTNSHPLLLFKLSGNCGDSNQRVCWVIQEYVNWLKTVNKPVDSVDELISEAVEMWAKLLMRLTEDEFVLSTQIDLVKASKQSLDHRCAIKDMIERLEGIPLFKQVKAILETIDKEFCKVIRKVGKTETGLVKGCCKKSDQCKDVLKALDVQHYLTVLLMAVTVNKADLPAFGNRLHEVIQQSLDVCGDFLKNEIILLRKQNKTLLGYMERCHLSGCQGCALKNQIHC